MIDVKALERQDFAEEYRLSLKRRGADPGAVDKILAINARRKSIITEMEASRAEQNKVGEEIARRKRNKEDASRLLAEMQALASKVKELDRRAQEVDAEMRDFALSLPNKLHSSVPDGESSADNKVIRTQGQPKEFKFKAKEHWEIGEALNIIDFERAGKVAGARFAFLKGAASLIERGLIQFM